MSANERRSSRRQKATFEQLIKSAGVLERALDKGVVLGAVQSNGEVARKEELDTFVAMIDGIRTKVLGYEAEVKDAHIKQLIEPLLADAGGDADKLSRALDKARAYLQSGESNEPVTVSDAPPTDDTL